MRVRDSRVGLPLRFVHRAAGCRGPRELLAVVLPLIEHARRRDAPVALITSAATERLVRQAVTSPDGLVWLPPPSPGAHASGQTLAVQRGRELRALIDADGPATVIAEHDPATDPLPEAVRVEADIALNVVAAALPVTMTCLYRATGGLELAAAALNHARLLNPDGTARDNPDHRAPAEVLARHPVPAPPSLGPPEREMTFTPWQLTELRAAVGSAARTAGLPEQRAADFVLAVNEVAGNAVEHGYGTGLWQVWTGPGALTCEVHDGGVLGDPLPGLRPPHPTDSRGRGVWIARQLCDVLHVWADTRGTHVRVQVLTS